MSCGGIFIPKNTEWISWAQRDYILHKQNYAELSVSLGKNRNTLQKYITNTPCITGEIPVFEKEIRFWVIIDATYLRNRTDGLVPIRTNHQYNLLYEFIQSESKESMGKIMKKFHAALYFEHTLFFTIDGRRFMFDLLKEQYPHIPIQMCLFHMKAIIQRYTTKKPKTRLWKALRILSACLGLVNQAMFMKLFLQVEWKYSDFLKERNEKGEYEHKKLRAALASIRYYLPYLYTYETFPERNISRTTGECDGYFSHIKDKLRVHRWLKEKNRNTFIIFLLEEQNRKKKS